MATRRKRFLSTAAAEALVRFGPELSGLRELQRTAQSNFGISVHQAQAGSRGIRAAVALAKPDVAKIYDKAGLAQAAVAHTLIGGDLASLGPGADRFKAAGAVEAAGSANRLNEAKSNSLNDLTSRGVRAKEGEQFQIQQARTQFVNDLTKVLQRKQDLRREKGAFTASEVDKLAQDAADRQLRADIASGNNATTLAAKGVDAAGNPLPGRHPDGRGRAKGSSGARLPGGAKLQPQSVHNTLKKSIGSARDEVADFVQGAVKSGKGRGWINRQLSQGIPGYQEHDPQTGRLKIDQSGAPVVHPGLKAVGEIERNVVLDILMYGGISHVTARKLHGMGYSVAHLGLPLAKGKNGRTLTTAEIESRQRIKALQVGLGVGPT